MQEPIREQGRLALPHLVPLEFPNQTILQYVTVCADKRRPLLAKPDIVALLLDCWRKADHWLVGRYVIMPDHLHLFCAPAKLPVTPLKRWVRFGGRRRPAAGRIRRKSRFGNVIFSTGSCGTAKAIIKSGFISGKIQSRMVW